MKELSLHILDIVQNSIKANASLIKVNINESTENNILSIEIIDNGNGIEKELLDKIYDPFVTTRTTRKVGLGISLFKAAAERCDGSLKIYSKKGLGTKLVAKFQLDHIDRAPLGNISDTIITLIYSLKNSDFIYTHEYNGKVFLIDTREIRQIIGNEVSIEQPEIIKWIKDYINEGIKNIYGGVIS